MHMWIESHTRLNTACILQKSVGYLQEITMNSVTLEILLIALIFALGITLCFQTNIVVGIGFIILSNIALPTIIKFSQVSVSGHKKLQQH